MTEKNPERETSPFIHLHIPKTAGTSLRRAFRDTYGAYRVMYYDNTHDRVIRSRFHLSGSEKDSVDTMKHSVYQNRLFRAALPIFKAVRASENILACNPGKLKDKTFDVLTGHFTADQLAGWGMDQLPAVTLVRNPLERTWSQYRHWKRSEGQAGFMPGDSLPFSPTVSFETFATHEEISNYQSRYLGSLSLRLTGVLEAMPAFLEELGIHQTPWVNKGLYETMPTFDSGFERDFIAQNQADYELYHATVDRWNVGSLALAHTS